MSSKWTLIENPAWAGIEAQPLAGSACHDHSHFVTVQCHCGEQMHMHQTQWAVARGNSIASICKGCGDLLTFPPRFFDKTLKEMRKRGWIV